MQDTKRLLSYVRRAVDDYEMIKEGDKIAVGVSAGKDSLTLLCAMAYLRRFYPKTFDIIAITIDMGFDGTDFSNIKKLCDELNVEYHIV
ncbi:MAG: tRNA 2-thiocytidine(32) synthetase TtcA, partial [Clostridia bacterium]|nr:tRNA 2-thiocytidine(32) synthetase TtcA [Clostridia bacterium]